MKITFFEDNLDARYAGHTFELFRVGWSDEQDAWDLDPEGDSWAILGPDGIQVFTYSLEEFG